LMAKYLMGVHSIKLPALPMIFCSTYLCYTHKKQPLFLFQGASRNQNFVATATPVNLFFQHSLSPIKNHH
jgi:hypothetical protein